MSSGRVITVGRESSHAGRRADGYDPTVSARAVLASVLLALLGPAAARGAAEGSAAAPSPAPGLAFAVTLRGTGAPLASGPYLLKVPGGTGPLRLELSRLAVDGARLRGEARLVNGSGLLLAGLALDFASASAVPKGDVAASPSPAPLALREPLAFGELLPGESTGPLPFEASPVPTGEEVTIVTLLGAVSGLAVEPPVAVEGTTRPAALDADRSGRLYVASGDRVLRLAGASGARPGEAARLAATATGLALRRRNGDLLVSTGGSAIEVHRAGRSRPATLDAGRPVTVLRFDGKGRLHAASGNAVLAFDEAAPGPAREFGPPGSEVLSFDVDARGAVHAVVGEGASRRVVVASGRQLSTFAARPGPGRDTLDSASACRFDGEGTLWVAARPPTPGGSVLACFSADGRPLAALPRLGLALLLGKDEDAAVPAIVDLAPGPERTLRALLDTGAVLAVRAF